MARNYNNYNIPILKAQLELNKLTIPNMSSISFERRCEGLSRSQVATVRKRAAAICGTENMDEIVFISPTSAKQLHNRVEQELAAAGEVINDEGDFEDDGLGPITDEDNEEITFEDDAVASPNTYDLSLVKGIKMSGFRRSDGHVTLAAVVQYNPTDGTPKGKRWAAFATSLGLSAGEVRAIVEGKNFSDKVYGSTKDGKEDINSDMVFKISRSGDTITKSRRWRKGRNQNWYSYSFSAKTLIQAHKLFIQRLKTNEEARTNLRKFNKTSKTYKVQQKQQVANDTIFI